jgi:hypothetical protein
MRYDITLNSAEALRLPKFELFNFESKVASIDDFLAGSFKRSRPALDFFAIATAIDLSDLGYAIDMLWMSRLMDCFSKTLRTMKSTKSILFSSADFLP